MPLLRSHFLIPVISPDSGRTSRLWSMSVPHVLSPQLWKTSHGWARWLQHLTAQTLSQKKTRRDAWLDQRSKSQYLMAFACSSSQPCATWWMILSPAWSERTLSIQKGSVPLQLRLIKVFECPVKQAKALCRATMVLRTDHTWEKSSAQQTDWGPNLGHQRLRILYELYAWRA
jgi:hypothetical protein